MDFKMPSELQLSEGGSLPVAEGVRTWTKAKYTKPHDFGCECRMFNFLRGYLTRVAIVGRCLPLLRYHQHLMEGPSCA